MSRTIGRHWPASAPRGDYAALCDVCGALYRRSQLVRSLDGTLQCSGAGTNNDYGPGFVELSRPQPPRAQTPPHRGGQPDRELGTPGTDIRTLLGGTF